MDSAGRLSLHVEGMTCGSCVSRVERALRSVPGVTNARVNLTTETATVELAQANGSVPALVAAVRDAGYDAEPARHPPDELISTAEQRDDLRSRRQRQALIQAIGLAVPVIGLEYLAPYLDSTHAGGHIWWRTLQALLCTMMLISPAGWDESLTSREDSWK